MLWYEYTRMILKKVVQLYTIMFSDIKNYCDIYIIVTFRNFFLFVWFQHVDISSVRAL